MIPVSQKALIPISINGIPDLYYRYLLKDQLTAIRREEETIQRTASELYDLVSRREESLTYNERRIRQRCCDFVLLESVFRKY